MALDVPRPISLQAETQSVVARIAQIGANRLNNEKNFIRIRVALGGVPGESVMDQTAKPVGRPDPRLRLVGAAAMTRQIAKRRRGQITPRAVEIFKKALELEEAGAAEMVGWKCERYLALVNALDQELGIRLYETGPLDVLSDDTPHPDDDDRWRAVNLRRQLEVLADPKLRNSS